MQAICSGGGDVLNIGFGLGLVDSAIQSHNPRSHTIVEAHPDVLRKVGPPRSLNWVLTQTLLPSVIAA